jgi:sugar phosphate isomerase/epimerase
MKHGICADLTMAAAAAKAGFDYIEAMMTAVATASDEAFARMADAVGQSGLPVAAMNVMLPGSFRLTGPDWDLAPVRDYLERGFARAERLGTAVQVFGSGAARRSPEGWPRDKALDQLAAYLQLAAPIAARHGIRIAIEPLNPGECNVINTVADALALARSVNLPNVGVLADWYHMALQSEGTGGVLAAGPMLLHCHIANPEGRRFPLPGDGADFKEFFAALDQIGYSAGISVEGNGCADEYGPTLARLKEHA